MAGFFVGTSGWSYDPWKADFYRAASAMPAVENFSLNQFSAVEIEASFYHNVTEPTYFKWRRQAGPAFRYTLKIPKTITHQRLMANIEVEIAAFWNSVCLLGDRLGAILLQVSPDMPLDLGWLRSVLVAFSDPSRVAVEFHAPTWQDEEVRAQLEVLGAAYVNIDTPHKRLNEWVTGPRAYLRLHGRRRWYADSYSTQELADMAALARRMAAHGADEVYIIFNNDMSGDAAQNAKSLQQILE
jgi:uncharacterized protein YecE (DUF72 family)